MKELTPHQVSLLLCLGKKGTVSEAAFTLGIQESSYKNQLRVIYMKLGAVSSVQALYKWMVAHPKSSRKWETYDNRFKRRRDKAANPSG